MPAKKKRQPKFTAKNSDRHDLYQRSVQAEDFDVDFIERTFRHRRKRTPHSLREDFCGTALLCAAWVESNKKRTATGVDIDSSVLAWGERHNMAPIDEPGQRVRLIEGDVRTRRRGKFDAVTALNFSYWIFRTREDMREYFRNVRRSLEKDGVFYLDLFGGWEAQEPMEDRRKIDGGFTYVWDQYSFDPITHEAENHIHFEFRDGSKMHRAFSYSWRFWSMPEIRELLAEAGFSRSIVYWDPEGENFRPRKKAENQPGWLAYLVALK